MGWLSEQNRTGDDKKGKGLDYPTFAPVEGSLTRGIQGTRIKVSKSVPSVYFNFCRHPPKN